ncbi:bestrophin-3-like [Paramacrobiotus metropolitanus]|uniref:bestrophin-3-like n=1 Tax=Paramacrobiotus metropolitanus TaxID=2943436 RepID=UPI0024464D34|nr:bestrophin-3-like [Paramacrobiotus metropolitanus]
MTVRYQLKLESVTFGKLGQLLLRWRGSVYKLMYREFLVFAILFAIISMIYRLVLNEDQRKVFEKLCLHLEETVNLVPLTFVLGFYVSFVLSRWWEQLIAYPWPDRMSYLIIYWINGQDERSYMIRRQLVRYITAATIFVNRPYSVLTRKRFPTLQHMVDAGILSKEERALFESITEIKEHGKFWVPCVWFSKVLDQARKEGLMDDPMGIGAKQIMDELLVFRAQLGRNWMFNWVPIPLAYTQVVTLAVYTFFGACLFARQPLDVSKNYKGHGIDTYFPIFTSLQFLFYVGWLKVAETIFNPWGEDDDDFDINWFIERHMQVHFTVTDQMFDQPPPIVKDKYWGGTYVQLPPLNKNNEALKPGDMVPPFYIDNYGRENHWPPSPPSTPKSGRFAKPKSPVVQETAITINTDATPTDVNSHNSSFRSYGTSLSRAVYWDGSPIFNPRSQKWPLLKDELKEDSKA